MNQRKVKHVRFHAAITVNGGGGFNTLHVDDNKVDMELIPAGLYISGLKGENVLVPFTNIHWCILLPEEAPAPKKSK